MSSASRRGTALAIVCLVAVPAMCGGAAMAAATNRTIYVSVTDGSGKPVTDLTAQNFKVKEGGKDREIVRAEPAKAPAHIALMVEERLSVDQHVREAMFEFVKRMAGAAEISLITVGLRNNEVTPFTSDPNIVLKAINELSLNSQPTSNLTEGINDVSKKFDDNNPERPVIVAIAFSGGQAGPEPKAILNQLRQGGAALYAVTFGNAANDNASANASLGTLGDESGREQVLGDGAKQSGGRRFDVVTTSAIPKALQDVASDILSQYAITYALPEGVKPDKRFSVSTDRKGVTLRAPSAIPDK
jgi:VWFA-related protein